MFFGLVNIKLWYTPCSNILSVIDVTNDVLIPSPLSSSSTAKAFIIFFALEAVARIFPFCLATNV